MSPTACLRTSGATCATLHKLSQCRVVNHLTASSRTVLGPVRSTSAWMITAREITWFQLTDFDLGARVDAVDAVVEMLLFDLPVILVDEPLHSVEDETGFKIGSPTRVEYPYGYSKIAG